MRSVIFPGSFDPFTFAHLDILQQSLSLFDHVFLSILENREKKSFLTPSEKIESVSTMISALQVRVTVVFWQGTMIELSHMSGTVYLIRGVRNGVDLERELTMFDMNSSILPELRELIILSQTRYRTISSTLVRELYYANGKMENFLPREILEIVKRRRR